MLRTLKQIVVLLLPVVGAAACRMSEAGRVDSAALHRGRDRPTLEVAILGEPEDASDVSRFFPFTAEDDRLIMSRWP